MERDAVLPRDFGSAVCLMLSAGSRRDFAPILRYEITACLLVRGQQPLDNRPRFDHPPSMVVRSAIATISPASEVFAEADGLEARNKILADQSIAAETVTES